MQSLQKPDYRFHRPSIVEAAAERVRRHELNGHKGEIKTLKLDEKPIDYNQRRLQIIADNAERALNLQFGSRKGFPFMQITSHVVVKFTGDTTPWQNWGQIPGKDIKGAAISPLISDIYAVSGDHREPTIRPGELAMYRGGDGSPLPHLHTAQDELAYALITLALTEPMQDHRHPILSLH